MKTGLTTLALIALLSASGTTTALAHEDFSESGTLHWIGQVTQAQSQPTANATAPYGYAVTGNADRVVNIDSSTRYLNVTRLETLQINAGGKSVTWKFDTFSTRAFPLSKVIPGLEGVTVYVDESPFYQGG